MITLVYLLLSEAFVAYMFADRTGVVDSKFVDDDNIAYWVLALTILFTASKYKFNWGKWVTLLVATALYAGLWALDVWYILATYDGFPFRNITFIPVMLLTLPIPLYPMYVIAVLKWVKWPKRKINAQAI
jgi:hypothetical protein